MTQSRAAEQPVPEKTAKLASQKRAARPAAAAAKPAPAKARSTAKKLPEAEPSPAKAAPKQFAGQPRKELAVPALLLEGDLPPPQPLSGPGARYALSSEPIVAHSPSMSGGELPEAYGTKNLFLAARDPHWLHASWDMTLDQQRELNRLSTDGHLVLRVYSDGKKTAVTEVHVHPESRSWFLNVPYTEHRYYAELGYYGAKRAWQSIAISRSTFTPPEAPATEVTADFATIPPEITFQQIVEVVQEFVSESQPLLEAVVRAHAPEPPRGHEQGAPAPAAPTVTLAATESFMAGVSPAEPRPQPETGIAEVADARPAAQARPIESPEPLPSGIKPVRSFRVDLPARVEFPVRVERRVDWTPAQAKAVAQLISLDSYRRVWLGSLEITELIRRRLQEEISSMAAAEIAREQLEAGAAKEITAPSSFMGPGPEQSRGFWFKVNAELIIYGSTDPKAKVTVAGQPIKLREDGSFSFRFSLPDGRYQLPAVAASPDGVETREARLEFSRSTEYHGQVQPHPQDPALRPPHAENVA